MSPGPASAIIVAGGQSRRMRREKSLLPVNGRTLIETVIAQIGPHFDEILVSTVAKEKFAFLRRSSRMSCPGRGR
jgi:molybdopterin-guanine dinucleotide biosynthesis protein A